MLAERANCPLCQYLAFWGDVFRLPAIPQCPIPPRTITAYLRVKEFVGSAMPSLSYPFSAELRGWRKAVGLKQEALAYLLGVTQPAVSRWEAGLDVPCRPVMMRLRDMMCVSGEDRGKVDGFAVAQQGALQASFDLDGVKLLAASRGVQRAWPGFTALSGLRLMDHLVDEAAALMHDDEFVRGVRRGEVALVSAVSVRHLGLDLDGAARHRWLATFRTYGTRMVINMTYEPCEAEAASGIERVVRLDELIN